MKLSIENLSVKYKGSTHPALRNISFQIQQGEFVGILGSSGAGKSTLIRCVNQLVKPTSGKVIWNGTDMTRLSPRRLRRTRAKSGMIFQQFHLVQRLNVLTNVLLGSVGTRTSWKNLIGYFSKEEREKAKYIVEQVGLGQLIKQRVEYLSGGQQQRVAIARMMLQQPKIMLGDEPVSSLDPVIARNIMDLLLDLHQQHQWITIMNLHNVELAKTYASRIIGLSHGQIVFDGNPDNVTPEVEKLIFRE